jgi:hypothetical protein
MHENMRLCFFALGQSSGAFIHGSTCAAPGRTNFERLFFVLLQSRGAFIHGALCAALVARILRPGFAFGQSRGAFIPHGLRRVEF